MEHRPETVRAALLLTNRLVRLDVAPLTAREFWELTARVDPAVLLGADVAEIADRAGVDHDEAARYRSLLDAATAMSFEQERLADGGVSLVSALDGSFPAVLRDRLGAACPPFLLVAGPTGVLGKPGLAVVGSDVEGPLLAVARRAAELAVERDWPVVGELAGTIARTAMAAADDGGGVAVGIPGEGITRASRSADVRRLVHAGRLCLASPYAPDARFGARSAAGRNKIVHALSQVAFVASAEAGSGTAWDGAIEAIEHRYSSVAAWVGDGATDGNRALVQRGATPIGDPGQLFDVGPPAPAPVQNPLF